MGNVQKDIHNCGCNLIQGIGDRLRKVEKDHFKNRQEMADFCGRSKSTVHAWMNGTDASLSAIAYLCQKKGIDLNWLVYGLPAVPHADADAGIDVALLETVIRELTIRLAKNGIQVNGDKLPTLIALCYEFFRRSGNDRPTKEADAFMEMLLRV